VATINSGNSTTLYSTTQTTTSVNTATNLPQDQVNETNFTTLYSNPSAAAQGGGTSGNLLVSGNLRVLGTSDLEGAVTISNSYILPTSDGTNGQVIVTDGSGNLTFQSVSSISSYSIQADTVAGGANLTLVGLTTTDSVKFASGTNMNIVRTDADIITVNTIANPIFDGGTFGNVTVGVATDNTISTTTGNLILDSASTSVNVDNDLYIGGIAEVFGDYFKINSDSTAADTFLYMKGTTASIKYDNAEDRFELNKDLLANGVQGGNVQIAMGGGSDNEIYIGGNDLLINTDGSHVIQSNSPIKTSAESMTINSDSTANDSYLYLKGTSVAIKYNNTTNYIEMPRTAIDNILIDDNTISTTTGMLNLSSATSAVNIENNLYVDGIYEQYGEYMKINVDATNADSYLYMKGTAKFLQWDEANQFFRFSNTLYGNDDIIAEDNLATNGNNIWFNYDDVSAADSYLTVKRGASADVSVRWNQATGRWQFTNDGTNYYNMVINIDDLNDVVITPPIASGQFLVQDGTNWINSSTVIATAAADRPRFQYNDSTAGYDSAIFLRKNLGTTAYTTGDGTGLGILIASDSQPIQQLASIGAVYNATAPIVFLSTNANPNTTGPYITVASFSSAAATLAGSSLTLDSDNTGAAADSYIYANRGSSGADAFLQWSESNSWWGSSGSLFAAANVIATGDLATNSTNIYFNYDDDVANDCFLQVKRAASPDVNIKWNEATDRWQTTVDGTNYLNIPNQNLDTTSDVTFASVTVDGGHTVIDTTTTTTTTTSATAITTTANATTRSSKFQIQVTDNVTGNIHVLEALIFFQSTTAYLTTYAEMYNSTSLATFTADVDSGNTRLLATPASANNTTFKVTRISVAL
jgi:hypothetical protein